MQKLYVTDLDGTLLTREERVSAYSAEKINGLIERGLEFTYATARSAASARRATAGLNLKLPAILYNGALIYQFQSGEVLRAVWLEQDACRFALDAVRSVGVEPLVFGARRNEEFVKWPEGRENAGMQRYLFRRRGDPRLCACADEDALLCDRVFYFRCVGPEEQLSRAWNVLKYDQRFLCIFHPETYQSDFLLEIFPREASKANAVNLLRGRLGAERVVCFGDTSNDSDMFDVCDEKYAVMNADDWLKEKATGIIGYCEEDGVAKWLEGNAGR